MSVQIWLTGGLTGVTLDIGEETSHAKGSIVYIESTSQVILYEFAASNGQIEMTDRDMIDRLCQMAGAKANFPGDKITDAKTLTTSLWRIS